LACFADVHVVFPEPQRLWPTKTPPVASLGGMVFVKPSLTADAYAHPAYFFSLPMGDRGQGKEMCFSQKNHRKTGLTK